MIRKSFLRSRDLAQESIQKWDLPGIGTHQIGFAICPASGLIMQSPSPTPTQIQTYYEETATYINPGRRGEPSLLKVKGLDRLINNTIDSIGYMPKNIFQVGCSDGYSLNRFKEAGAEEVTGIDPSRASHELAKKLYNIDTIIGTIESYENETEKFDLVILTHVLEHLFNPIEILEKCFSLQNDGDWALIEVPLFERMDLFPPGLLTLEHLNYFSEGTIFETCTRAGYEPILSSKYFSHDEYPIISIIARKNENISPLICFDYEINRKTLINYLDAEKKNWSNINVKLKKNILPGVTTYIYGAGIHTTQLLANTEIMSYLNIQGLLDSSPTKWGKNIGKLKCWNIKDIQFKPGDAIVISSFASESEIFESVSDMIHENINIVRLYD
jgi:hypothetical protein